MAGVLRVSLNGEFYYGDAEATADTLTTNVSEVTLGQTKIVAEALRRSAKYKTKKPIATEVSLDFKVWDIVDDAFLAAMIVAFNANTPIALFATTELGGEGLDADFYITEFSRDEDNEGFAFYMTKAEPTDEVRDPSWQSVTTTTTTTTTGA